MAQRPDDLKPPSLFDGAFYFLLVLAIVSGALAIRVNGLDVVPQAMRRLAHDGVLIFPQVVLGVMVGALFTMLVPRQVVSRFLGQQSGIRGILLATLIGAVMPGGPFASFPIVYALGRSGAGIGALIAFLTSWAAIGFHRLIVWEMPFMGLEFAVLRVICSIPLPILAGIFARWLSARFGFFRMKWD